MSTAAASKSDLSPLSGPAFLLVRRLQSLTGIMFGGYLLVHLTVNATIAQGGSVYQDQVNKIHSLPFLTAVEWSAIFIPFLFHAFYGLWIAVNGRPNVGNYPFAKNTFYLLQRLSAFIILVFVLFHVLALKYGAFGPALGFDPHAALPSIGKHFAYSSLITWVVYPIGILAAAFHTANGFATGAITWGLTVSTSAQKRVGKACCVLAILLTLCGLLAVAASSCPAIIRPAQNAHVPQ